MSSARIRTARSGATPLASAASTYDTVMVELKNFSAHRPALHSLRRELESSPVSVLIFIRAGRDQDKSVYRQFAASLFRPILGLGRNGGRENESLRVIDGGSLYVESRFQSASAPCLGHENAVGFMRHDDVIGKNLYRSYLKIPASARLCGSQKSPSCSRDRF